MVAIRNSLHPDDVSADFRDIADVIAANALPMYDRMQDGPRIAHASAVLSFARALGEFGATLTFAGSLQGTTRTLPLEIYLQRETSPDTAVALSLVLVVVAVVVVSIAHQAGSTKYLRGAL